MAAAAAQVPQPAQVLRYLYLHGYGSSPHAPQARALSAYFKFRHNVDLIVPHLDPRSVSGMVSTIDQTMQQYHTPNTRWRIIGASMGGYLTALVSSGVGKFAPQIDSVILLCPAFGFADKFPGFFERFPHWPYPLPHIPVSVIHGTRDEMVPIDNSRRFVSELRENRLTKQQNAAPINYVETQDGHHLMNSLDELRQLVLKTWFS